MKRVLVTGASGFVGRRVCQRMLDTGLLVRAAVRQESSIAELDRRCEPCAIGPIEQFQEWERVLAGVDGVVHLVARTHQTRESGGGILADYRAVNVEGTRRLLEGCHRSSVTRFVFVSSIKALGEAAATSYAETDPSHPKDAYGISKREAELLVLDAGSNGLLEPVVLRPPLVYGPGVRGNFQRLLSAVDRGVPFPLGAVSNARSLIYVENLADAIAVAMTHPQAPGEVFHVADETIVSTPELIRLLADGLGREARLLRVPTSWLALAARVTGKSDAWSRLAGSLTVCCEKIQQVLNWVPAHTLQEGIRKTTATFRTACRPALTHSSIPCKPTWLRSSSK